MKIVLHQNCNSLFSILFRRRIQLISLLNRLIRRKILLQFSPCTAQIIEFFNKLFHRRMQLISLSNRLIRLRISLQFSLYTAQPIESRNKLFHRKMQLISLLNRLIRRKISLQFSPCTVQIIESQTNYPRLTNLTYQQSSLSRALFSKLRYHLSPLSRA